LKQKAGIDAQEKADPHNENGADTAGGDAR